MFRERLQDDDLERDFPDRESSGSGLRGGSESREESLQSTKGTPGFQSAASQMGRCDRSGNAVNTGRLRDGGNKELPKP